MGNFFTTMQIYDDEKMSQEQFIDKFCREICDEGYVACGSDESELSYILKFADNCQWVTVTSEDYKDDMDLPRKDVVRIAKMLGTACVQTTVIDSDCAVMELYNAKGEQADMFVIGRADDYFGDNIPQPKESIWKPFLTESTSWDDFNNLKNGDYVFVEDGLSELAPVIGMDSRNIVFEADEAVEDEQTVFLYFRKADSKIEKKLTLNAAFKQVFGEALEPFGFKKIKSKYPYYVRIVGNEILHIITVNSRPDNRFEILGGIATIYRQALSLDKKPIDNKNWLLSNFQYYRLQQILNVEREYKLDDLYEFYGNDLLISEMNRALNITQNIMLELFDKVDTLEKCIDFYNLFDIDIKIHHSDDFGNKYPVNFYNEGLLLIKTTNSEQYNRLIDKYNEKILKIREYEISNGVWDKEKYNVFVSEQEEYKSKQLGFYKSVLEDKDWFDGAVRELEKRKAYNASLLQQYGI